VEFTEMCSDPKWGKEVTYVSQNCI